MHPLVRGAAAAAILTALGNLDRDAPEPPPATSAAPSSGLRGVQELPSPCGLGTLPEGPVCLRIPGESEAHPDKEADDPRGSDPARGELGADRIPRRPERPADPAAYLYPVGAPAGEGAAPRLMGVTEGGRPGVRVAARPGEKVRALGLPHQLGPAEVVFVGDLVGRTVVTAHTVDEGARRRTYLLVHGSLDRASPEAVPGARLETGAVLGFARTENAGRLIEVYVEARELREGRALDAAAARPADPAVSVPTDVRNVLPLR